ncbi:helix-turn-helix domain-containing protein [uncultured Fibrella sp.]|uniref:helix-turn-helix domain-containing protein n=1 Tax=uncultured Fibrella sp. TaxID=1284596 RepID=UPI0035CA66C7
METIVERPTLQDQQVARESLPFFATAIQNGTAGVRIQVQNESEAGNSFSVTIPAKAFHLLAVILSGMAEGKGISLAPSDSEVSTQQAADLLAVSRPHIVKLLEAGAIPFRKVGSHRRISLADVLDYATKQQIVRDQQLAFLTQQAQALNLGYE